MTLYLPEVENDYVLEFYNKIAKHFQQTRVYLWPCVKDFLERTDKNDIIGDIGSGSGRYLSFPRNIIGCDLCNNLLQLCGPSVNVSTVTAYRAIELGGYTSVEIFNEFGDIDTEISKITPEFLANPQLIGFLLRVSLQQGDPNTNHFTALRKDTNCPNMFKYIESRPNEPHRPGPWTQCLNVDMGQGVVKGFLNQHSDRIKSIIAVYNRQ